MQKVLGTLEPGKFSPVIKTDWGCCIVKRKKLTDEDILSVVKEQARTSAEDQMYQELDAWRKRAKIQYSAAYAPAYAQSNPARNNSAVAIVSGQNSPQGSAGFND